MLSSQHFGVLLQHVFGLQHFGFSVCISLVGSQHPSVVQDGSLVEFLTCTRGSGRPGPQQQNPFRRSELGTRVPLQKNSSEVEQSNGNRCVAGSIPAFSQLSDTRPILARPAEGIRIGVP